MPHVLRERIQGLRNQIKAVAKQCFDLGIHDHVGVVKRLKFAMPGLPPAVWQLLAQAVMEILRQWLTPARAKSRLGKLRRRVPARATRRRNRKGTKAPPARV